MLLEHGVTPGTVVIIEQHHDLIQTHTGSLAAQDHRDPHHVVIAVEATIRAIASGMQEADILPVP